MKKIQKTIISLIFILTLSIFTTTNTLNASSLTPNQIQAIISLLKSFGADSATVAKVQASLEGGVFGNTNNSNYQNLNTKVFTHPNDGYSIVIPKNIQMQVGYGSENPAFKGSASEAGFVSSIQIETYNGTIDQAKQAFANVYKNTTPVTFAPDVYMTINGLPARKVTVNYNSRSGGSTTAYYIQLKPSKVLIVHAPEEIARSVRAIGGSVNINMMSYDNHACIQPYVLQRTLYLGTKGESVAELQNFLTKTGDYIYGRITGYYGPATMRAVQKYQCREMGICYGSANSNGYGVVGPRTREKISCNSYSQNVNTTYRGTASKITEFKLTPFNIAPGQRFVASWTTHGDIRQCDITELTGPTYYNVGASGTKTLTTTVRHGLAKFRLRCNDQNGRDIWADANVLLGVADATTGAISNTVGVLQCPVFKQTQCTNGSSPVMGVQFDWLGKCAAPNSCYPESNGIPLTDGVSNPMPLYGTHNDAAIQHQAMIAFKYPTHWTISKRFLLYSNIMGVPTMLRVSPDGNKSFSITILRSKNVTIRALKKWKDEIKRGIIKKGYVILGESVKNDEHVFSAFSPTQNDFSIIGVKLIPNTALVAEVVSERSSAHSPELIRLFADTFASVGLKNGVVEEIITDEKFLSAGLQKVVYTTNNGFIEKLELYYKNGQMAHREYFKDGMVDGSVMTWYENGKPKARQLYKNGKLHGKTVKWYENGVIANEIDFEYGKRHGYFKFYDKSGKLLTWKRYNMGSLREVLLDEAMSNLRTANEEVTYTMGFGSGFAFAGGKVSLADISELKGGGDRIALHVIEPNGISRVQQVTKNDLNKFIMLWNESYDITVGFIIVNINSDTETVKIKFSKATKG